MAVTGQLIPGDPSLADGAVDCNGLAIAWSQKTARQATFTTNIALTTEAIRRRPSVSNTRNAG